MFKRLLQFSFYSYRKQKASFIINIVGFSIALATAIIIATFIYQETSYDIYHQKKNQIFRMVLDGKIGAQGGRTTATPAILGPTLQIEYPEIEGFLRMHSRNGTIVNYDGNRSKEEHFIEADSSFFEFFSIPLKAGDPKTCLSTPRSVVLSASAANRIFGTLDPMNQSLLIGTDSLYYAVSGVYDDIPKNTHFQADLISSFMTNPRSRNDQWMSNSFETYVMLNKEVPPKDFEGKLPALVDKYVGLVIRDFMGLTMEEFRKQGNWYTFFLQPLTKIHLDPSIGQSLGKPANPKYLYIFGSVALLIILIAAINYINLLLAQSTRRRKEIGIKKVCGSTRGLIINQFLLESVAMSLLALFLAVIIVVISFPFFSELIHSGEKIRHFAKGSHVSVLLVFTAVMGLLSGIYPAFYLSSVKPVAILNGQYSFAAKRFQLRSVMVVFQLVITLGLITGALVMNKQMQYLIHKDLGYQKENLLVVEEKGILKNRVIRFKDEVLKIPGVKLATISTAVPGHNTRNDGYRMEGQEEAFLLETNWIDEDFFDTYGLKVEQGRFFNPAYSTDQQACLVNQATIEKYNLDDPLSERFVFDRPTQGGVSYMPIIGIVNDFNFRSLHGPIEPYLFCYKKEGFNYSYVSILLEHNAEANTLKKITDVWKDLSDDPIQYFFMDEDLAAQYRQEKASTWLAAIFALIAISIAVLGLYGLTSFSVQRRQRELAIRKTLGASLSQLSLLLVKDILIMMALSVVIAWPLVYYLLQKWLQEFEYRIQVSALEFILGLLAVMMVVTGTISRQIIQASHTNPVEALKHS